MPLDETTGKPKPQPHDYDIWVECRNCGILYQRQETEVEPSDGRQAKIQGIKTKTKGRGRGNNPRIKKTRDEIKDPDLIRVKRWCSAHILFVNGSVLKGKMIHNCHISTSYSKIY